MSDHVEPPPRSLRVTAVQLASTTDTETNLEAILRGIDEAADAGSAIVVFPEAAMASFAISPATVAQPLDGPFAAAIRDRAMARDVVAVVGIFEPAPDGRTYNTLLVVGRDRGSPVELAYRKVHLFDAFGSTESETVAPGDSYLVAQLGDVVVGFATCYDLRFAEQFTSLGLRGAEVVIVPASWGDGPGKAEQWDLLTRARACDAQAWLVACGQAWQPPQGAVPLGIGHSLVADPLGSVHGRLDATPGMLSTTLDVDLVSAIRREVPVLQWVARNRAPGSAG